MLDLHRLRVLFELQRLGTVTAVAEALQYTHSAISQQLAHCERDVGVKLYEKVGRRIRLTEQGEILAEYAGRMLALSDEAESRGLASTSLVRGTIRVTSFQTVMSSIIPAALTELARTRTCRWRSSNAMWRRRRNCCAPARWTLSSVRSTTSTSPPPTNTPTASCSPRTHCTSSLRRKVLVRANFSRIRGRAFCYRPGAPFDGAIYPPDVPAPRL